MTWITTHPGDTYLVVATIELIALTVMAGALVSIAISLNSKRKEN